jgi:hypothetical protein
MDALQRVAPQHGINVVITTCTGNLSWAMMP